MASALERKRVGFQAGAPLPARGRRPQLVAALIPHDLPHAVVAAQLLDDPLAPAGGGRRVFMQEVSTSCKLQPVDLHCKTQQDHGLRSPPPSLRRAEVAPVEVLNGAELGARRAADHEERLLLPNMLPSPSAVIRPPEVPSHPVGVAPQVEG